MLRSGTLVQVEVEPGEHLFLASTGNWSYLAANLLPGKRYFIKADIFPDLEGGRVALVVVAKTDPRIHDWLTALKMVCSSI